jgi:hypothetical protein
VPGPAWAQSPGLGWALAGSGLQKPKPDPELRAGPGLGLVGLKPGLMSQRSNSQKHYTKNTVSGTSVGKNAPKNG